MDVVRMPSAISDFLRRLTGARKRAVARRRSQLRFEALEPRAMMTTTLGLGDIAFTGYQASSPDKVSFVLLKDVTSGTILTVTDNAWSGTALGTSEGNSVLTFGAGFSAGTQFNYDASRGTGTRWAVGATTTGLSDATGSNFALNASGDNLFAYNGNTAPSSGTDSRWIAALASNPFLASGSSSSSLTYLPAAFTQGDTALSLGLANGASNQNGALTKPATISGTAAAIRSTVYTVGNWTTFTSAGGQAIPPAVAFSVSGSGNTNPTLAVNAGLVLPFGSTGTISNSLLQASDAEQTSPASLTFTVKGLPTLGQLRKSGTALTLDGTFTQDDINSNRITYAHGGLVSSNDSFTFTVTDGVGGSLNNQSFAITVNAQVVLSELKVNPPGSTTNGDRYQYIELRGTPNTPLTNHVVMMLDGNGSNIGRANYVMSLTGFSLGSNGYLVIKSQTTGHSPPASTTVVTDVRFDQVVGGALSKQSVTFILALATGTVTEGTDFDANNDGTLDNLPAGFVSLDSVGWRDETATDVVYGDVVLSQNQGTPDAATRFLSDWRRNAAAWYNGDLNDVGNDPTQLVYDTTRRSSNFPTGSIVPRLTPGAVNFSQSPTIATNLGLTVTAGASTATISDSRLTATDTEQTASELYFTVTTLPTAGSLRFNGSPIIVSSTVFTQSDIAAGRLTYEPPTSSGNYHFSFVVGDGYATETGSFSITVNAAPVNSLLRIVNYNLASSGDNGIPRTGLTTLIQAFGTEVVNGISRAVDLLLFQEVRSQATTTQYVVDQLNGVYGTGIYKRGTVNGATTGAGTMGVVYNSQTLQLLGEAAIGSIPAMTRQAMRYLFRPIGAIGNSDFYVYVNHLKASNTSSDRAQRLAEAQIVRNDADALGDGKNIIYAGDFNVYTSSEGAFQEYVGAGFGQAFDPVNRLGSWSGSSSFRDVMTQAPSNSPPSGLIGGGLDDRFDFQLLTGEFFDGTGLEYLTGSYRTFGNNGSVAVNGSINASSNTALSGLSNRIDVLNLLTTVSDHLPVIADYTFPTGGNTAPSLLPQSFTVAENSANGTVVGTVVASDPDAGDTKTFSIVGGNELGAFAISSGGTITVADSSKLDYETRTSIVLTVRVTDSGLLFDSDTITINLNNVVESPVIPSQSFTIAENRENGFAVGTIAAVRDASRTIASYTILSGNGSAPGAFSINSSGQITVADSTQLDFETVPNSRFELSIRATDSGGATGVGTVTIQLSDVVEGNLLSPGDLVITGFNGSNDDEFTFVPLVNLAAGTQIRFTDNGWLSTGGFRTGEGVLRYSAPAGGIAAGTRIGITKNGTTNAVSFTAPGTNPGHIADETSSTAFSLATTGDQLIAFQGSLAQPTVLFALTTHRNAFNATAADANTSALPTGLTLGTTAIAIGNSSTTIGNGAYNDTLTTGTVADLRSSAANLTNWNRNDSRLTLTYTNFTVNVGSPPSFSPSTYTFSLPENSAAGTSVGSVSATDPDPGTTIIYGLTGTGSANFTINSATGAIQVAAGAVLDFETTPTFLLTASASDGVQSVTAPVTIQLTDVNENANQAPQISNQSFSIHFKPLQFGLVGTVSATDPNAGQSLSYAITGGNGGNAFTIDSATGTIRIGNASALPVIPKNSTSTSVPLVVTVTDNDPSPLSTTATITVTLQNSPPVRMSPTLANTTFSIAENNSKTDGTTKVGTLKPTAAYSGQKFLFSTALSGPDASTFRIDAAGNITLAPAVSLNYETTDSYSIIASVADSVDATKVTTATVSIIVKNINEAPVYELFRRDPVTESLTSIPIANGKASFSIEENEPSNLIKNGLVVGIISGSDVDQGTVLSLQKNAKGESIVFDKTGAFELDLATGEIRIADETKLNFESRKSVALSFSMVDTPIAGDSKSKAITTKLTVVVNLIDLNEAPVFSGPSTFTIAENNKAGAKVGSVKAVDADKTKQTLTYSIVSQKNSANADVTIFSIDPTSGAIVVQSAGTLNFEASASYALLVRVTDNGSPNLSVDQPVTVNVTDLNEVATFVLQDALNALASSLSITGTTLNGDKIGRLLISDLDAGDAGGYTAGSIASAFVAASKGALTYNETTGDILIVNKGLLTKSTTLKVSISDRSVKPVKSTVLIPINVAG
jgi:endonuclease/exonuclease/phosphatase family metal-dependent hydrolase